MFDARWAVEKVLELEGYYSNDPLDHGGETIYGIASRWHKEAFTQVMNAPKEQQKGLAINWYVDYYWTRMRLAELPFWVAFKLFECSVNQGEPTAVTHLQKTCNTIFDTGPINGLQRLAVEL